MTPKQHEKATRALNSIERLHPNIMVLSKLTGLLKDLNIDQQDLVDLIKTDASMTSDIIRISNTAFYGLKKRASDVQGALMIIGQNRVLQAVGLCVSRNVFNKDLEHYGISADDYWSSSIAAGLLMEALAQELGIDTDKAYTIGIVHSIGMTIINRILDDLSIDMYWDSSIPQVEWEEHLTGYNFAAAGADVLEKWNFPPDFCAVIRYQVAHDRLGKKEPMLDCLHFVVQLLDSLGWKLQAHGTVEMDENSMEFLDSHKIARDDLDQLLVRTRDQMTRVMRLFSE